MGSSPPPAFQSSLESAASYPGFRLTHTIPMTHNHAQAGSRFKAAVELATDNVYGGAFRGMTSVRNQTFMVREMNVVYLRSHSTL